MPVSYSGPAPRRGWVRTLPPRTCIENTELNSRGSPISPPRAISTATRFAASKCRRYDHQLDVALLARPDHLHALGLGRRHRLLAQHVDAVARGHERELGVQVVGDGDVDRVDRVTPEQLVEAVVRTQRAHAVAPAELVELVARTPRPAR